MTFARALSIFILAFIALACLTLAVSVGAEHPQFYVQLIVKACPAAEIKGQENRPPGVLGYYTEPINQGTTTEDHWSKAEAEAYFTTSHCIDVPVPSEVMVGGDGITTAELTPEQCRGHRGYLTAMEYLRDNPAYKDFPAVGMWSCVVYPWPASGVAGM